MYFVASFFFLIFAPTIYNLYMDIKKYIKNKGFTLSAVAARLNISQQALSEQIKNGTIAAKRLQDIADIIGCSVADLVTDAPADSCDDFAALVHCGGVGYTPRTLEELRALVQRLERAADVGAHTFAENKRR